MSKLHDISDLEAHRLNQILDNFSIDAVLGEFNDDWVYICEGRKIFRLARDQISPDISVRDACRQITYFDVRG